ncbi:MAG: hypothetical protein HYR48_02600 [Gemmatimonadetes bacterium]|nr:hypothetical protein [Gemmatimonadota bacterium]
MRAPSACILRLAIALALLAAPGVALGYAIFVHDLLPTSALGRSRAPSGRAVARDTLPGATDADVERFRAWFHARARALPDTAVRNAFLRRYPTVIAFDARAFKELLMMNGQARALGVDSFAAVYRARSATDGALDPHVRYRPGIRIALEDALQLGSIYVDLDRRNQNRLWWRADGTPDRTATGDTVPFDPMTLNMGKLTGGSSQAHAHYGLNHHPKSGDRSVLRSAPWDFAIAIGFPGEVRTYAEESTQLYTDLAILALLSGQPGGSTLSAFYAGNAMHFIADVANPVHTVQAGNYDIYVDATLSRLRRQLATLFGLLGAVPTRNAIGEDILTNLHNLSEKLFKVELESALDHAARNRLDSVPVSMQPALAALEEGDGQFGHVLSDSLRWLRHRDRNPDFGRAVTAGVVEATYRDGAELYRLTRRLAIDRLRRGTLVVDFDTIPDARVWEFVKGLRSPRTRITLQLFNGVQARGLARATEALRLWWGQYVVASMTEVERRGRVSDETMTRLLGSRLAYLRVAEGRRARWIASHGGLAAR